MSKLRNLGLVDEEFFEGMEMGLTIEGLSTTDRVPRKKEYASFILDRVKRLLHISN